MSVQNEEREMPGHKLLHDREEDTGMGPEIGLLSGKKGDMTSGTRPQPFWYLHSVVLLLYTSLFLVLLHLTPSSFDCSQETYCELDPKAMNAD